MSQLELISKFANGALYKDAKGAKYIKIDRIRASYPVFGTPQEMENDAGKTERSWGGKGLLPKVTHKEAKDVLKKVINELMTENDVKVPSERWFLKDGDGEGRAQEEAGMFVVAFNNKRNRPTVRDQKAEVMDDIAKIDDKFYGGCWISVMLRPWFFDGRAKGNPKPMPKRVCCGLQSVQFIKDDEPFGSGRIDDSDQWKAVEDEGDGMDSEEDDGL